MINLLGLDIDDPEVASFIASVSADATWEYDDDASFCSVYPHGVELKFGRSGKVNSIFMFPDGEAGARGYKEKLPAGIDFKLPREAVRRMLAPPVASGGQGVFLNEPVPPWDKYKFENYSLHPRHLGWPMTRNKLSQNGSMVDTQR